MKLPDGVKLTPMLEQYLSWKKKYPDELLFFRMGDFYEMFFEDAKVAASVLDIVLTARDQDKSIPMAGVPYHSVDSYLGRLIAAGYRVAVCDQVTEPDGKNLVKREVTRIVTPGTWLPDDSESEGRIAACAKYGGGISIALLVSGTGSLRAGTFTEDEALSVLASFKPNEVIVPKGESKYFSSLSPEIAELVPLEREKAEFAPKSGAEWLKKKWDVATLSSMGVDDRDGAAGTAAAALKYLEETQFSKAVHITALSPILQTENLILDSNTQSNLELLEPAQTSLFSVLNKCNTACGRRTLRDWIVRPMQDTELIGERQDAVRVLLSDMRLVSKLRDVLSGCRDMAKSLSRITLRMGTPPDLAAIRDTLLSLPNLRKLTELPELRKFADFPDLSELTELLEKALAERPPRMLKDGGIIKEGFDPELDMWREKLFHSENWLERFEAREKERTGIKNLKTGVNKVFGYYIEIPKGSSSKAPIDYTRKQTLVNAERFITEELKIFEKDMFRAEEEIAILEHEIFGRLINETVANGLDIQRASDSVAVIDVLVSFALIADERRYVCPKMTHDGRFYVKGARHPVIEVTLGKEPFTPNDFELGGDSGERVAIITGPNMAGKSTYLRTAALIAIMAHIGSFVPAESAEIGIIDRVFTRIGARDELARGQSTFMVEMVETANILRHATDKSLVILDEVGRGTSTYDGLSIAWSVVEYLHGRPGRQAKVLFATHYHELTKLAGVLPGVVNLSMAVEESGSNITFLYRVERRPASRSYGIEVARLAGVPQAVLLRSKELLSEFERAAKEEGRSVQLEPQTQMRLFDVEFESIVEELAVSDPDEMTPMEALQLLYKLRLESRKALGFST